jgi:antitoxin ParD1/3/4
MNQISITLPEPLTNYLEQQITAGNYSTPSDYIQALIQQDQAQKADLEELLLAGINSGSATPMTDDDWDTIRANVNRNLNSR